MTPRSKLAVIVHADVVGSTALVQQDERLAHDRIQSAFRCLADTIRDYSGIVHEQRGDALVAEFNRVSDAVCAGLSFQERNSRVNQDFQDDLRPVVRIGIALGEVITADRTVTGAGVVLAQRLEQLAEPGGVCVQGAVKDSIPKRYPFAFTDLGNRRLKGFEEAVRTFSVGLEAGESVPPPEAVTATHPQRPARRRRPWLGFAAVLLVVAAAVIPYGLAPWHAAPEPASDPSIAVLAFSNLGQDPEQQYFGDGLAEDIITDLSKIPDLLVIARNSSFAYKDRNVSVRTIGAELGVKYVLEGSVRRAGDSLRINAQLIDVQTEGHLWAERFDGALEDVFELQDRITRRVVDALAITLRGESRRALNRAPTHVAEAYDAYLRGIRHINARGLGTLEHVAGARREFQRAVELDPGFALAYAGLGWANWNDYAHLNTLDRGLRLRAFELAGKSLALVDNALARRLRSKEYFAPELFGYLKGFRPERADKAIMELRRAVALEPGNADAMAELAYTLVFAGHPEEAVRLLEKARRLNPGFPDWYLLPMGIAHYLNGDYERAIPEFAAWHQVEPVGREALVWLAAAHAQAGHMAAARDLIATLPSEIGFPWSQQIFANRYVFVRESDKRHFMEGLGKAGLIDALKE